MYSLQRICDLFSPDIAVRVVGVTPFLNPFIIETHDYIRHEAVLAYLRQNHQENALWVAIDDIAEFYEPGSPVVVTNTMASIATLLEYSIAIWLHLVGK